MEELTAGIAETSKGPCGEGIAIEENVITACIYFAWILDMDLAHKVRHIGVWAIS